MDIQDIILKLEQTHKIVLINEEIENKWFWSKSHFYRTYFDHKENLREKGKRKTKQFLVLTGRQLQAANKLIKFIPFLINGEYANKWGYSDTKEGCSMTLGYIEQVISMMFFEPICNYTKENTKWLKIEDIILNDSFDYELSLAGAKKWFDRNYPRTLNERNITNMPIPDGRDEWPSLRCNLYSFGSFHEVRVWGNRD